MNKRAVRKNMASRRLLQTVMSLILAVSMVVTLMPAMTLEAMEKNNGGTNIPTFDEDILDYGIYWYGRDNSAIKFVDGQPNANFDSTKPTMIFAHGWQPSGYRENYNPHINDSKYGLDEYTANYWIDKGWNIGIFYWAQMAYESEVKDAEAKIWTGNPTYEKDNSTIKSGMRWKDGNGNFHTGDEAPDVSVCELYADEYIKAMANYSGSEIRLVGHSLGNQVATRTAAIINDKIESGQISEEILPSQIVLHDPFWSNGSKTYLEGKTVAQQCNEYVTTLKANGVVVVRYDSGMLNAQGMIGDVNGDGRKLVAFFDFYPDFVSMPFDVACQHGASKHWYFTYMRMEEDVPEYGRDGSPTGERIGSCLTPIAKLAKAMNEKAWWYQDQGKSTADIEDDTFMKSPDGTEAFGSPNAGRGDKPIVKAQDILESIEVVEQDDTKVVLKCNATDTYHDISRFVAYVNGDQKRVVSGRRGTEDFNYITIDGLNPKENYEIEVKTISSSGWEAAKEESGGGSESQGSVGASGKVDLTTKFPLGIRETCVTGTGKAMDDVMLELVAECPDENRNDLQYSFYVYQDGVLNPVYQLENSNQSRTTFTPTKSGSYRVVLRVMDKNSETHRYRETSSVYNVIKNQGSGTVSIANWEEGQTPRAPVLTSNTNGIVNVKLYYKTSSAQDSTYTEFDIASQKYPTAVGTYTLKSVFPATDAYEETVVYKEFSVVARQTAPTQNDLKPQNPTSNKEGLRTPIFKFGKKSVKKVTASKKKSFTNSLKTTSDGKVTYSSSNKKIATVSSKGKVTIRKGAVGSTIITARVPETKTYKAATAKYKLTINPTGTKLVKLSNKKARKLQVTWKKNKTVSGYQIQYCKDKKFKKGVAQKTISKKNATSYTFAKIKKKGKYYVRVRTYKKVGKKKFYSSWSKAKAVKVSH